MPSILRSTSSKGRGMPGSGEVKCRQYLKRLHAHLTVKQLLRVSGFCSQSLPPNCSHMTS